MNINNKFIRKWLFKRKAVKRIMAELINDLYHGDEITIPPGIGIAMQKLQMKSGIIHATGAIEEAQALAALRKLAEYQADIRCTLEYTPKTKLQNGIVIPEEMEHSSD